MKRNIPKINISKTEISIPTHLLNMSGEVVVKILKERPSTNGVASEEPTPQRFTPEATTQNTGERCGITLELSCDGVLETKHGATTQNTGERCGITQERLSEELPTTKECTTPNIYY